MHVIRTESDLRAVEKLELLDLIRRRMTETAKYVDHFSELVFFVIVEPGDDISVVDDALGFPVMANRFDGMRFGEPGFTPSWDVFEEHAGYYEFVYVLNDEGSGVTLFVAKLEGVSPELLSMCRRFVDVEANT